jgi:hypothetical protein
MKRRVMFAGVAAIAGLLVPLAAAAPSADAGTGVGCVGSQCSVSVWQFVKHGPQGSWGASGNTVIPINVPPPPCLWNPIGDATTGSQYIISQFGSVTQQDSLFDVYQSVQQAKKLLANPTAGTWYELPVNPNASPAGQAECAKLPLFAFVPPDQTPPMPNVPPLDLAEYAYNHIKIPPPTLTLSSANGKAFVNLATYVWATSPPRVTVWAALGNERVTLIARPVKTVIASSAGTPANNCGVGGSRLPLGSVPKTAAGVPPDCGVLWTTPTADATITATVTWRVTWSGAGGAGVLKPIDLATTSGPIRVSEIQSINGNGPGN